MDLLSVIMSKNSKANRQVKEKCEKAMKNKENINNLAWLVDEISGDSTKGIPHKQAAIRGFVQVFKIYLTRFKYGISEDDCDVTSEGKIASWLYERYQEFLQNFKCFMLENPSNDTNGEMFGLFVEIIQFVGLKLFVKRQGEVGQDEMMILLHIVLNEMEVGDISTNLKFLDCLKYKDFFMSLLTALPKILGKRNGWNQKNLAKFFHFFKLLSKNMPRKADVGWTKKNEIWQKIEDGDSDVQENDFFLKVEDSGDVVDDNFMKRYKKKFILSNLRRKFGDAWVEFLKLKMPTSLLKEVLKILKSHIIPNFQQPRLLSDFLMSCYHKGSGIAVLSLQGLFELMQHHNLECENFYTSLYGMLHPRIFEARYKSRFFYLLNIFLSSTHVQLKVVAAFVKKLARLSIVAPPIGARLCVKLSLNLIRRYPGCKHMLDCRNMNQQSVESDPFNDDECEPLETRAFESSLWELKCLQDHYLPNIKKMTAIKSLGMKENEISELLDEGDEEIFDFSCNYKYEEFAINHIRPSQLMGGFEDICTSLWK